MRRMILAMFVAGFATSFALGQYTVPVDPLITEIPPSSGMPTPTQILISPDPVSAAPGGASEAASAAGNASADTGGNNDNGTNPAQNATTFIVSNEYYTLDGNNRINTVYARYKFPWYNQRGSLLFEVPFVY